VNIFFFNRKLPPFTPKKDVYLRILCIPLLWEKLPGKDKSNLTFKLKSQSPENVTFVFPGGKGTLYSS
jgi:hypothetical protein